MTIPKPAPIRVRREPLKLRDYLVILGLANKKSRARAATPAALPTEDGGDPAMAM